MSNLRFQQKKKSFESGFVRERNSCCFFDNMTNVLFYHNNNNNSNSSNNNNSSKMNTGKTKCSISKSECKAVGNLSWKILKMITMKKIFFDLESILPNFFLCKMDTFSFFVI